MFNEEVFNEEGRRGVTEEEGADGVLVWRGVEMGVDKAGGLFASTSRAGAEGVFEVSCCLESFDLFCQNI